MTELRTPLDWERAFNLMLIIPAIGWEDKDFKLPVTAAEFWERAKKGGWRTLVFIETMPKRPYKKPEPELTDTDKMPFGMHKDKPMQDVPASYFHYLWTTGLNAKIKICPVARYIQRNMDSLKMEHKDGIWE